MARVTRILCAAAPRGSREALERLLDAADRHDVDAVALVGDLTAGRSPGEGFRAMLHTLGRGGLPSYWVPGPDDAPIADCLREAYNSEVVFPALRGVHGTAAFASPHIVVAGFGGAVSDDNDAPRDELERLRYARWEPEYRLKLLHQLDEHQFMLLFSTPPAHKGLGAGGSEVLTELITTFRPRLVVSGGERGVELLGRSLVVAPGELGEGRYAVADVHAREAELLELAAAS